MRPQTCPNCRRPTLRSRGKTRGYASCSECGLVTRIDDPTRRDIVGLIAKYAGIGSFVQGLVRERRWVAPTHIAKPLEAKFVVEGKGSVTLEAVVIRPAPADQLKLQDGQPKVLLRAADARREQPRPTSLWYASVTDRRAAWRMRRFPKAPEKWFA